MIFHLVFTDSSCLVQINSILSKTNEKLPTLRSEQSCQQGLRPFSFTQSNLVYKKTGLAIKGVLRK